MSFKDEFIGDVVSAANHRIEDQGFRPGIEVWPGSDDFDDWVAFHESKARAVICRTSEFKDTLFCGTGFHG